ncbi:MAG: acyltransferase [Acidobacteria bacterium]|nr:acyltransferase [Acidobacteriota bacterium]
MKAGFLQFQPVFGDIGQNISTIREMLNDKEFDLMVLPELCTTGYQFVSRDEALSLSEPAEGALGPALQELAERKSSVIVAGFAEKNGNEVFNSAMAMGPDGVLSVYRKAHLFFKEKDIFRPGNTPFEPVDTKQGYRLGTMICFDWIFPEAARSLALGGASVIAHSANLVLPWCQQAMFARALENRIFIITANRFGTEDRDPASPLTFTGGSQIMAPDGEVLAKAGPAEAVVMIREIDLNASNPQLNPMNHLFNDCRPDLYRL